MSINSGEWDYKKQKIAQQLNDITMLWNCGIKNRNNVLSHNIKSWKDTNCTAKTLGFKDNQVFQDLEIYLVKDNKFIKF